MSTVLNKKKSVNVDIFLLLLCFLSQTSDELTTMITRQCRVAELGSLSSGAKMAMKIFVRRVFTIFAKKYVVFARNHKVANLTQ